MATVLSFANTTAEMSQTEITEKMLSWDFSVDEDIVELLGKPKNLIISAEKKLLRLTEKLDDSFSFVLSVTVDEKNQLLNIPFSCIWHSMSFKGQKVFDYGFGSLSDIIDYFNKNEDEADLVSFLKEKIRESLQKQETECNNIIENAMSSREYAQKQVDKSRKLLEKREEVLKKSKDNKEERLELNESVLLILD